MMAAFMVLSCLTVAAVVSSPDSDAADLNQGDAWGYGVSLNNDTVLQALFDQTAATENEMMQSIHEYLDSGDGKTAISYDEFVKKLGSLEIPGYTIDGLKIEVDIKSAALAEVAEASANGYVLVFDSVNEISIKFSADITGLLPVEVPGEFDVVPALEENTIKIEDFGVSILIDYEGSIILDGNKELVGAYSSSNIALHGSGSTNVSVDGDKMEYADEMHKETFYVMYSQDAEIILEDGVQIAPGEDEDYWFDNSDAYIYLAGYISSDLPIGDLVGDSSTMTSIDAGDLQFYGTVAFDDPDYGKVYALQFSSVTLMYPDIEVEPVSKETADRAKGIVKDVHGAIDDAVKDKEFTVKFLDADGKVIEDLTKTVKYGQTVSIPEYPGDAPSSDAVLVGWECGDIFLTPDMPVKSDLVLAPEFAEIVSEMPSAPSDTGAVLWKVDADSDDLGQSLNVSLVDNRNYLYIEVFDADGKMAYTWSMNNKGVDLKGSSLVAKIDEKEIAAEKQYIIDAADGRSSLYLEFGASGKMPSNTSVYYNVEGKFADGSTVTIYYDNGSGLEYAGTTMVAGGYVGMCLTHCSSYVLFAEAPREGGSSNTMIIIAAVVVVLIAVVAVVLVMKRKKSTA